MLQMFGWPLKGGMGAANHYLQLLLGLVILVTVMTMNMTQKKTVRSRLQGKKRVCHLLGFVQRITARTLSGGRETVQIHVPSQVLPKELYLEPTVIHA